MVKKIFSNKPLIITLACVLAISILFVSWYIYELFFCVSNPVMFNENNDNLPIENEYLYEADRLLSENHLSFKITEDKRFILVSGLDSEKASKLLYDSGLPGVIIIDPKSVVIS